MMIIGVDAHKSVHAAVALDDAGREVAAWRGPNSPAGGAALAARARPPAPPTRSARGALRGRATMGAGWPNIW